MRGNLRDYALVAFLRARGHALTLNTDGSYQADMEEETFMSEVQEYKLYWKPILRRIMDIKREISLLRPHAVNLDSTLAPKGPNNPIAAQRGSVE